jgi:hypothetical protein
MESMTANIIHDTRLIDRYEPLINELFVQGIKDYKIWNPVEDVNSTVRSINLSHKQIVRWAKEMKLKRVLLMEDDCYFPSRNGFKYFIEKMPWSFDIYSACNYLPVTVIDGYATAEALVGFHCYVVDQRYYDTFLATDENLHIDNAQDGKEHEFIMCYPYPALQREGFSSNNKALVNYNTVLTPKDIYS